MERYQQDETEIFVVKSGTDLLKKIHLFFHILTKKKRDGATILENNKQPKFNKNHFGIRGLIYGQTNSKRIL